MVSTMGCIMVLDVVSELNMMNGYSDLAGVNRKILNPIVKLFSEENID